VLILIAAFIPSIFEGIIEGAAKSGAALTQENETNWKGIPGAYDIELNWVHYLYQVTNHDDVSKEPTNGTLLTLRSCLSLGHLLWSIARVQRVWTLHLP